MYDIILNKLRCGKDSVMKLIFVRHGDPDYANDCLTETGTRQAQAAAERLKNEHISAVFSSPKGRAVETAKPTAEMLGLPVTVLPFMREISWGTPDGRRDGIYNPWNGASAAQAEGLDLLHPDYDTLPFWNGTAFPESCAEIRAGLDGWLLELGYEREGNRYRCVRENHDTVVLFAHGGSGAVLFAHLLGLPEVYTIVRFHIGLASVSEFSFGGTAGDLVNPSLMLLNDQLHILGTPKNNTPDD